MRFGLFIARKIYYDSDGEKKFSRPAIRIAIFGIAVGLIVMLVSLAIVLGFKKEISSKVAGFGAHAQIVNLSINENYEANPVVLSDTLLTVISVTIPNSEFQVYASKLGMLKTDSDFCGINFKGVGEKYNLDYFESCLVDGVIPSFSAAENTNNIVISLSTANMLGLKVGMPVYSYFLSSEKIRSRKFNVAGIYNTNLTDYDKSLVLTDIYTVRRLNGWDSTMVTGCEINIKAQNKINEYVNELSKAFRSSTFSGDEKNYKAFTIKQLNPQIFSWLDILDANIVMILILMICVSSVTVASGLLIIMLERINMIGVLKALGTDNSTIRNVFINFALLVIGRGLIIGNVLAIALCYLQKYFSFIPLDSSVYYIDTVPVEFHWGYMLLINLLTIVISLIVIWGASFFISIKKTVLQTNIE
jgi:lipoprotein-releasing system permease protein